ncbi:MAG: hypothetical protein ACI8X5_000266 [Planctomycetota bacterium]|jgi:hypothetical protein
MEVRLATAPSERQAVYEFRYRIYVGLEGRTQINADHQRRQVREPLDDHGMVFAAFDRGRVIGTLRSNLLADGPLGNYDSLYGLDQLSAQERQQISITTKLMVEPDRRGGACAMRLSQLTFRLGLERGVQMDFIDSRDHTLPFFDRLGYRVLRSDLVHPEYGLATLLRLDLHDTEHLASVGSPFLSTLKEKLAA